jgi:hypothetical protein
MGLVLAAKAVALDRSGKASPLGPAHDVDALPRSEYVSLDALTYFIIGWIADAKLAQYLQVSAHWLQVASSGQIQLARFNLSKAKLNSRISIGLRGLDLGHITRPSLNHGNRHDRPCPVKYLGHAYLFSDNTLHSRSGPGTAGLTNGHIIPTSPTSFYDLESGSLNIEVLGLTNGSPMSIANP